MSKLTVERGQSIIKQNRDVIYHLPSKYKYLNEYLKGSLRGTLLDILNFLKNKNIIIDKHKYMFFLSDSVLNVRVRKKYPSSTGNRHINLLCAIGLFKKEFQSNYYNELIRVNKNFLDSSENRSIPINVFSFRRWTDKELQRCEDRAERLRAAGVTTGNMSNNYLHANGLEDMARELYPKNSRHAPYMKEMEYKELLEVIEACIDSYGYCNMQMLKNNLPIQDKELDQVRRIYKRFLAEKYYYKRPTKDQIQEWNLEDLKYIYTRREKETANDKCKKEKTKYNEI